MSIELSKLDAATKHMVEYRKLVREMSGTAMQLFTHPDASANDVMRTQQSLMRTYKHYRAAWEQMYAVAVKYPRLERMLENIRL